MPRSRSTYSISQDKKFFKGLSRLGLYHDLVKFGLFALMRSSHESYKEGDQLSYL
jgi:hypothetical protein